MKVLLAVGENSDARAASDYLAARFDGTRVGVDVLSVVHRPRSPVDRLHIPGRAAAEQAAADERVADVAKRLGEDHGFRLVRTHVQHGVVPDVIVTASERWRSTAVLIGAPREPDLLTTLGFDSVAHAVARRAPCPVEMLRTTRSDGDDRNRVLIVTDALRLDDFPFDQVRLQSRAWRGRSHIRVLAVLPAVNLARAWAIKAVTGRRLDEGPERRSWVTARLDDLCRTLVDGAEGRVEADHRLVEGSTRHVALASAKSLAPSLLVLDESTCGGWRWGVLPSLSSAALSLNAPCSVLLLRSSAPSRSVSTSGVMRRPQPSPVLATRSPRAIAPPRRRVRP